MGAKVCQFGVVHSRCRCMCPDKEIACDKPEDHQGGKHAAEARPGKHAAAES